MGRPLAMMLVVGGDVAVDVLRVCKTGYRQGYDFTRCDNINDVQ